ncbi:hypothetical protein, partial [Flavobacterium suncheonense]|uniref:hypothetical protein n=1 Tax=Flavobacterium suncheonense TaxID=350894 RepID=UPI001969FFF7
RRRRNYTQRPTGFMKWRIFITDVYKYTEKLERKSRREVKTYDSCSFHYTQLPPLHKTVVSSST